MKILITGAQGFIGKHLCNRLIQNKEQVYGVIRPNTQLLKRLNNSHLYCADVADYPSVEKIVAKIKPDIFFHLAAYPDTSNDKHPIPAMFNSNVLGTFNLLMASKNIPYKRFIFVGSYKEYGNHPVPFKEDYELKPQSSYAASKAAAEQYCALFNSFGKPITRLRLATVYGPGQSQGTLIGHTIKSACTNAEIVTTSGTQARDFLYVDDAIEALMTAAYHPMAVGKVFNIGSGYETSVKEMVETIVKLCRSKSKINRCLSQRVNDPPHMYGDISKARKLLNWSPTTSLDDGLKKTIEGHRKN